MAESLSQILIYLATGTLYAGLSWLYDYACEAADGANPEGFRPPEKFLLRTLFWPVSLILRVLAVLI